MAVAACQQKKENPTAVAETGTFACPMKCEGEKTYPVAGKCPVCKMDLVVMDDKAVSATYEIKLASTPDLIEAGKPTTLAFTPRKMGDPTSQVPLDEVHEHKIHVIIVSKDLSWYSHIHPVYQPDGSYVIEQNFPTGGEFIIFSDFQPSGATNQVYRSSVMVTGITKPAAVYAESDLVDEIVHVAFEAAVVVAGEQHPPAAIKKDPPRRVNRVNARESPANEKMPRSVVDRRKDDGDRQFAEESRLDAAHRTELVRDIAIFDFSQSPGMVVINRRNDLRITLFVTT